MLTKKESQGFTSLLISFFFIALGAFISALSLDVFLLPNHIIDGGIVGLSILAASLAGSSALFPLFFILLSLPFIYLAYRQLDLIFVCKMLGALLFFALSSVLMHSLHFQPFRGDPLEIVVMGGILLGGGFGCIIRMGGCLDGTEILAILINRKKGFSVGQVVLTINLFIFALAGFVYHDWHSAIFSFLTYIVAAAVMDKVILGIEEIKSVTVISPHSKEITQAIMEEMGIGVTLMYGHGAFSKEKIDIVYVVVERLQFSELKELVHQIDPNAFITVQNLHDVQGGRRDHRLSKKA